MPIFDIPVREFPQHVLVPLVKQRINKLIQDFNLQDTIKNNIHIKYGLSAGQRTKDHHKNVMLRTNRLDAEVDVSLNPDNQKWDIQSFKYNPGYGFPKDRFAMDRPIFQDPEVGIYLYLHIVPCVVTINITFTLLSKTTAYALQSAHYELHGWEESPTYGDFMFDLPLNKQVVRRLFGLFKMRRLDPKKVSFPGYLYAGSITKIGYQINRTATDKEFIIRQHQVQMLEDIVISSDKPQEVNDQEGTIAFTVPFTYTIQFARPAFYNMQYPIVIMNKLIPVQHLPHTQELRDNIRNVDMVKAHLSKVTYQYWERVYKKYDHLFVSPFYEDWREPARTEAKNFTQRPFWIITILLDENEDGTIKNETWTSLLGEIVPKYRLHPVIEDIIATQGCESYEPDCICNVSVFRDEATDETICYHQRELDWDTDSCSVIIKSTNRAQRYHIVISEMMDFNFLNPKWYFLLERYKYFFADRMADYDKSTRADDRTVLKNMDILKHVNNIDNTMKDFGNGGWIDHGYHITARVIWAEIIPLREELQQSKTNG